MNVGVLRDTVYIQNLAHLLCEMRDVNKGLQFEVDDHKQKLHDAQGDIKVRKHNQRTNQGWANTNNAPIRAELGNPPQTKHQSGLGKVKRVGN